MTMLPPPPPPSGPADESSDAASAAMLGRAVASLQRFPDVPPGAVDRVVAAAVARNGVAGRRSVAATWLARAAVLALAAGLGAVAATYTLGRRGPTAPDGAPEAALEVASMAQPAPLPNAIGRPAAAMEEGPIPTPFVLARPAAHRVAVVGDFNGWDPTANVMTTDARGVWTITVALPPGRHAYAFVVDGAAWVTDPRAPVVRDADYGRDQSVVLVGHP